MTVQKCRCFLSLKLVSSEVHGEHIQRIPSHFSIYERNYALNLELLHLFYLTLPSFFLSPHFQLLIHIRFLSHVGEQMGFAGFLELVDHSRYQHPLVRKNL